MPAAKSTPQGAVPKRLYRSNTDRMIAGVAGGFAEYFNLDPAIIRILFVLLLLFEGGGLVIYLILWLVLPTHKRALAHAAGTSTPTPKNSRLLWGLLLIFAGLYFLAQSLGLQWFVDLERLWPILFVFIGLFILIR
jgi:phage shock protein C